MRLYTRIWTPSSFPQEQIPGKRYVPKDEASPQVVLVKIHESTDALVGFDFLSERIRESPQHLFIIDDQRRKNLKIDAQNVMTVRRAHDIYEVRAVVSRPRSGWTVLFTSPQKLMSIDGYECTGLLPDEFDGHTCQWMNRKLHIVNPDAPVEDRRIIEECDRCGHEREFLLRGYQRPFDWVIAGFFDWQMPDGEAVMKIALECKKLCVPFMFSGFDKQSTNRAINGRRFEEVPDWFPMELDERARVIARML